MGKKDQLYGERRKLIFLVVSTRQCIQKSKCDVAHIDCTSRYEPTSPQLREKITRTYFCFLVPLNPQQIPAFLKSSRVIEHKPKS